MFHVIKRSSLHLEPEATKPEFKLRAHITNAWHYIAICSLFFLWGVWVIDLLLFGTHAEFLATETLLSIPVFFILDWILQRFLNLAIGFGA